MFDRPKTLEKKHAEDHKTWTSCFASNYTSLIRPYAFSAYLMGWLPYKMESSEFVFSKLWFIYSTIIIIIYLCFIVWSAFKLNIGGWQTGELSILIHCNLVLLLGPIVFVSAYAANRSVIRTIQSVSKVSRLLTPEVLRKLASRLFVRDTLLMVPPCSFIPLLFSENVVVFACTCWCTFFGVLVLNRLYINNVHVLEACFKQINDSLMEVNEILINDEPHLLRRVYHTQKNPMLLMRLKTLKKQHLEISKVVQLLNSSFSVQNLAIFTLLFVDITFNLYNYLLLFNAGGRLQNWFSFELAFIIYYVFHIILTVGAAEMVRDQVEKIGTNIHRILVRTFDEQVTTELELFSLQVLQMDNSFTAKGIIIDATLLTKIFCSIATFFLILIQFLIIKPC